jgi:hypothetical protein
MQKIVALQVDVYADNTPIPVVRHVFYGEDEEEAEERFRLHCNADAFLRDCFKHGGYNGMQCRVESGFREIRFDPRSSRL